MQSNFQWGMEQYLYIYVQLCSQKEFKIGLERFVRERNAVFKRVMELVQMGNRSFEDSA